MDFYSNGDNWMDRKRFPKTNWFWEHIKLIEKGFEPLPPLRLVPNTSAIDHSATLPALNSWHGIIKSNFNFSTIWFKIRGKINNLKHALNKLSNVDYRRWQHANLCSHRESGFESDALITRPHLHNPLSPGNGVILPKRGWNRSFQHPFWVYLVISSFNHQ